MSCVGKVADDNRQELYTMRATPTIASLIAAAVMAVSLAPIAAEAKGKGKAKATKPAKNFPSKAPKK